MPAVRLPGVFCLETSWDRRLDDKASVLPILDLLHRTGHARYIHRDVGTVEELFHYLSKWRQAQYSDYRVLYFAFHGERGCISVGKNEVSLNDLGEALAGAAAGRTVVFGSCNTLKAKREVDAFRKVTKAKVVCGYTREVDWLQSAAFELLMLGKLAEGASPQVQVNRIKRSYPDMVAALGFESYPRSVKQSA